MLASDVLQLVAWVAVGVALVVVDGVVVEGVVDGAVVSIDAADAVMNAWPTPTLAPPRLVARTLNW
jgi:hypothetical protein